MKRKIVSVTDVNRYVKRLLEEDYVLGDLWVSGEISNCKYHHTGHIYFTLKDKQAGFNVAMFAKDAENLSFELEDGMYVYTRLRISLYEKTGVYQGYVTEIEQQGIGSLYEAFERLKKNLAAQGFFDQYHKKALPVYPIRVGIITSKTGAAIKDIIQVAKRRNASIPLYLYPVHVQGNHAKDEIVEAIKLANKQQLVDVLIVGRGGGSIEDLWAFNEVCVAQAIFESTIPIVSAVGHEVDFTISDFVADMRAATPSAAAELVIPDASQYLDHIKHYQVRLTHALNQKCVQLRTRTQCTLSRPVYTQKMRLIQEYQMDVIHKMNNLEKAYKQTLEIQKNQLVQQIHKLDVLSPLKTLSRGYAVVTRECSGDIVNTSEALQIGERFKMTLSEGFITGKVEEKG